MTQWTRLAAVDELKPGDRKTEFIDDNPVLLVRIDDDYFCVADVCSHDGQPLGDGPISDKQITCTRHGARFDLANGNAMCMPATEPIVAYTVQVTDDGVLASLGPRCQSRRQLGGYSESARNHTVIRFRRCQC
jgi:3-phenylpropionate/trans-cinnamate dioxygenase ferredoxin subunit